MKKRLLLVVMTLVIGISGALVGWPKHTGAYFNQNDIIDDWLFDSASMMSAAQIDAFLNGFSGSCISSNNGFKAPDVTGYSPSTRFVYGADVTAGTVIYSAAQAYGLNPQVILTTLEKEQSLVRGSAGCSSLRYVGAMGNDCPDSGPPGGYNYSGFELYSLNGTAVTSVSGTCVNKDTSVGFSKQVIWATWKLKFWKERSEGHTSWAVVKPGWDNSDDIPLCYNYDMTQGYLARCPGGPVVYYEGFKTVDGTTVHLDNGATAALYIYTPHFHGNQLFVSIFEGWFGSTTGEGYTLATSAADNGDLRQWVVYHGQRHWVTPEMIAAWGLPSTPIQWPGLLLGSFPDGAPLGRLMRPTGTLDVYFVDGGNCYRVRSAEMMSAWNFNAAAIQDVSVGLGRAPANQGNLTYSIKAAASNTIYYVDGGSKRQYATPAMQTAWEGLGLPHAVISTTYLQAMGQAADISTNKAVYGVSSYLMSDGRAYVTVDQNISNAWGITNSLSLNRDIASEFAPHFMLTRFARSIFPNDLRLFVVDNGVLYVLNQEQAINLGLTVDQPRMLINPEAITPTISPWTFVMVHDTSGRQYVIDAGTKRSFHPDGQVLGSWLNSGTLTTKETTNGFLNMLPNNGTVEREIKGTPPAVYVVQGLSKRWVLSPVTAGLYAPIQSVSDALINALPSSTNI